MSLFNTYKQNALWGATLLAILLVAGCAGIEPYQPRDHREEGPQRGLLSGEDGEFSFYVNLPDNESDRVKSEEAEPFNRKP
jgi:hypothetical protein